VIRRLLLAGRPAETRFFLFLGGFGLVLAAIYWFLTYELAGTVLLAGFGLGALVLGVALLAERRGKADADPGTNPFGDERGRLPAETLAPLALGLGVSLALTAVVFGPWLVVAGIVPLAWGAWTWLRGARDELDATVASEAPRQGPTGVQSGRRTTRATSDEG
jgi:hypothetical protein